MGYSDVAESANSKKPIFIYPLFHNTLKCYLVVSLTIELMKTQFAFANFMDYLVANAKRKFAVPFRTNANPPTEFEFRNLRNLRFAEVFVEVPNTGR